MTGTGWPHSHRTEYGQRAAILAVVVAMHAGLAYALWHAQGFKAQLAASPPQRLTQVRIERSSQPALAENKAVPAPAPTLPQPAQAAPVPAVASISQTPSAPAARAQPPLLQSPAQSRPPMQKATPVSAPHQPSPAAVEAPAAPATASLATPSPPTEPTAPNRPVALTAAAGAHSQANPVSSTSPQPTSAPPTPIALVCPQQQAPTMPRLALRLGISGVVQAVASVRDGRVVAVDIVSGPAVFHEAVRQAMLQYQCTTSAQTVQASQSFAFKVH